MAFTECTTTRTVKAVGPKGTITLADTVRPGDPVGYSSGWKRAVASATAPIAARFIALEDGTSGEQIEVTTTAIVSGFSGATAGDTLYLGTTAGTYRATLSTNVSVRQELGLMLDATDALISTTMPFGVLKVGADRSAYIRLYQNAAASEGDALRAYNTVLADLAATGAHGIHGSVSFNAGASVTGLAAGIRATLDFAANTASPSGTYCALQVDSNIGAGITMPSNSTSFIRVADNGAVPIAALFSLPAAASGNCVLDTVSTTHNHSIRILLNGEPHYLVVNDAPGS